MLTEFIPFQAWDEIRGQLVSSPDERLLASKAWGLNAQPTPLVRQNVEWVFHSSVDFGAFYTFETKYLSKAHKVLLDRSKFIAKVLRKTLGV